VKGHVLGNRWQVTGGREAASNKQQAAWQENSPVSPFAKGGKRKGEIAAQPSAARNDMPQIVIAVILAVVVGFGVSFAIEFIQAYLPSRDSSLRDLITNVLGTFIGAGVGAYLIKRVGISGQWSVASGQ